MNTVEAHCAPALNNPIDKVYIAILKYLYKCTKCSNRMQDQYVSFNWKRHATMGHRFKEVAREDTVS